METYCPHRTALENKDREGADVERRSSEADKEKKRKYCEKGHRPQSAEVGGDVERGASLSDGLSFSNRSRLKPLSSFALRRSYEERPENRKTNRVGQNKNCTGSCI